MLILASKGTNMVATVDCFLVGNISSFIKTLDLCEQQSPEVFD
jgi:hypothetical protein